MRTNIRVDDLKPHTLDCMICSIDAFIAKADDKLTQQLKDAGFVDAKKSVKTAAELERSITEILQDQSTDIADALKKAGSLSKAKKLIAQYFADDSTATAALTEVFESYYKSAVPALATDYMKEIATDMVVETLRQRTVDWLETWSKELADLMQLNGSDRMGELIQETIDNGESIADLTRKIRDEGIRGEEYTARRAALTEMLRAHSVANHEAIMQSPAASKKMWRHTGAYRIKPRENHEDMDGSVVPKDEPFILMGADGVTYYPMYPRDAILPPGEAVNCHCLEQPVVDEDVLGMSLEERQELQRKIVEEDDDAWMKELDEQNKQKRGSGSK